MATGNFNPPVCAPLWPTTMATGNFNPHVCAHPMADHYGNRQFDPPVCAPLWPTTKATGSFNPPVYAHPTSARHVQLLACERDLTLGLTLQVSSSVIKG